MNDPNGLLYHAGEYHLFYQWNPDGDAWGNIAWGHAVSRDLRIWEELGVAIAPEGEEMPFSGSAVMDGDTMVAVFTVARAGRQVQALAFSSDRGRTFTRYAANPVLDIGSADFRDPKVFAHDGGWVMAVALSAERRVQFYRSEDLRSWTPLSDFACPTVPGTPWECPDLFALDGRWVLIVSVGPAVWYWVGDFDGERFVAERHALLDYGPDLYAPVTFNGAPRRVLIGWMNNWTYAHGREWRSFMSVPRVLSLRADGVLVQRPAIDVPLAVVRPGETLGAVRHEGERVTLTRGGPEWFAGSWSVPAAGDVDVLVDGDLVEVFAEGTLSAQLVPWKR